MELSEKDELVEDVHLFVKAALFRQVADAVEGCALERLAEEGDGAGIGAGDADHHADGGGFAGAVGAEEAEHLAGFDRKGQALDGDLFVVQLADVVEFDDGHGLP